jgi:hypothetical protein
MEALRAAIEEIRGALEFVIIHLVLFFSFTLTFFFLSHSEFAKDFKKHA